MTIFILLFAYYNLDILSLEFLMRGKYIPSLWCMKIHKINMLYNLSIYYNIKTLKIWQKASWCPSKLQLFSNLVFQETPKSKTCVKTENLGRSVLLCSNVWDSRVSTKLPSVQIVIWATTARTLCIAVVQYVTLIFLYFGFCKSLPFNNRQSFPVHSQSKIWTIVKIVVGPNGTRYAALHDLFGQD